MSKLTVEQAEKIMKNVPEQHHFKLHMGTDIRNLTELAEALEIMADRSFEHHVSKDKNDFSAWIHDVIGDIDLAQRIKSTQSRKKMAYQIRSRINYLETKPSEHVLCKHNFMKCGANDFAVGIVVGFVIGIIIAAVI